MDVFSQDLFDEKVAQVADAFSDLKKYRTEATLERVRNDPELYYAVCYRFLTGIEALFDVGQYVLDEKGVRADSQREIPPLLVREGLIPDDIGARFSAMYGFRNRLAHAYGTLDDEKVIAYLTGHLNDIEHILHALSNRS